MFSKAHSIANLNSPYKMALHANAMPLSLQLLTPRASAIVPRFRSRTASFILYQLYKPLPPLLPLAVSAAISLNIPSILSGIWESILRAVPKKKTSHMKKRHRFMAGKALKDITNLNKCSACGNVKRAHLLCPYCVRGVCFLYSIILATLIIGLRNPRYVAWENEGESGVEACKCIVFSSHCV